jgi:hypothetical protein
MDNFLSPAIRDREWTSLSISVDTGYFATEDARVEGKCLFAGAWE